MLFNYAYNQSTTVADTGSSTGLNFSPDVKREPAFFSGELYRTVSFREAISALHDVVVSDLRFKPKDRTAYLQWVEEQEKLLWGEVGTQRKELQEKMKAVRDQLQALDKRSRERWQGFYEERQKYFNYLYKKDRDAWFVLDPVITVHPDEVFFECFSQDESSYGRLSVGYDVFKSIGEFACGTTNIDYSAALYNEFQKMRSYKTTTFAIDPSGFEVQTTHEESYKEVKIDLPDSWVRGFLQVNSAMCLPMTSFILESQDIYNFCFILHRHKEIKGPRSLRFQLKPGTPVKVIFEPWNYEVVCRRSVYTGNAEKEIRVWGRRRLHILERLIPVARKFSVHLLGTGMPSFFVADLGDMAFTLGLSGWTANDWSTAGNFDLMTSREEVDEVSRHRVYERLKAQQFETPGQISGSLGMERSLVLSALSAYAQAGRAIFDLNKGVYRLRELTREPLPMEKLRFANPQEESAGRFLQQQAVSLQSLSEDVNANQVIKGMVKDKSKKHTVNLVIDKDERLIKADCTCSYYFQNKLYKGPCEHMLALRMMVKRQQR